MPVKNLIEDDITLTRIAFSGENSPQGLVSVPFVEDSTKYSFINIAIDFNQDGKIEAYDIEEGVQEEWIVQNIGTRVLKDEANNFGVFIPDMDIDTRTDLDVKIQLSKKELKDYEGKKVMLDSLIAKVDTEDVGEYYRPDPAGVRTGGLPFDALKPTVAFANNSIPNTPPVSSEAGNELTGAGEGEATAGEETPTPARPNFNQFHPGVPDLNQERNECVQTSVANSILWLAKEYNFEDKLPAGGSNAIINELKNDMNWTANGTNVVTDFIPGKNAFTRRHNIAIETHQVGGRFDTGIVAKIAEELKKGQDVEIDMEYGRYSADGSYRRVGGHMVTVVGAWTAGDSQFLDIHDPLSRSSRPLDIYKIDGTRVINYAYQGTAVTYIRFAIAESPIPPAVIETSTTTPPVTTPPEEDEDGEEGEGEVDDEEETTTRPTTTEMAFGHVAPGSHSEVYLSVSTNPGTSVTASLSGPEVENTSPVTIVADSNGIAYFTWKIYQYGTYSASVDTNGERTMDSVFVD